MATRLVHAHRQVEIGEPAVDRVVASRALNARYRRRCCSSAMRVAIPFAVHMRGTLRRASLVCPSQSAVKVAGHEPVVVKHSPSLDGDPGLENCERHVSIVSNWLFVAA